MELALSMVSTLVQDSSLVFDMSISRLLLPLPVGRGKVINSSCLARVESCRTTHW